MYEYTTRLSIHMSRKFYGETESTFMKESGAYHPVKMEMDHGRYVGFNKERMKGKIISAFLVSLKVDR